MITSDMDYKDDNKRCQAIVLDEKMMSDMRQLVPHMIEVHKLIKQRPLRLTTEDVKLMDTTFEVFITHLLHCELDQRYLLNLEVTSETDGEARSPFTS